MARTRRRVALTASAGIAATLIGGQTIHAWSGIGARQELIGRDLGMIRNGPSGRRLRLADALVIDEVSMLSGDVLSRLWRQFRRLNCWGSSAMARKRR